MEWLPALIIGYFIISLSIASYGLGLSSEITNPHHRRQEKGTYIVIGLVWLPLAVASFIVMLFDFYKRLKSYLLKRYIIWQNK